MAIYSFKKQLIYYGKLILFLTWLYNNFQKYSVVIANSQPVDCNKAARC